MAHVRFASVAITVILAAAWPVSADDADAKAIIEKAIKAHGGLDNLAKFTGGSVTFKGTFYGMGEGLPMSGTVTVSGRDKQKVDLEIEVAGQKFAVVVVLAGNKGWTKFDKEVKDMDADEVAEAREQAYAAWVATLAPLSGKQFQFAKIGDVEINNRKAVGVKVSSKGHRDVDLYFDKETFLLVKIETIVKDDMSGKEVIEENFPSQYKDVQGTKQAVKFVVKRDGKLFLEGEASEIHLAEKIDDATFAKP
ncbi:MAG: hypothetical protein RMJ56_02125 [Gemmataceae bacterium]|nr:hypothetical protein [Gemmata sp.]MDW8196382.1 hypothetical protein [Gemmataceae bacterium]